MTDELFDEEDRPGGPRPVDHRKAPTRAGLVVPDARGVTSPHPIEMRKAEFEGLAAAIGLDIAFSEIVKLREVKPATFIGGGRLDEIKAKVKEQGVGILLFDTALAPVQQRNLETETGTRCWTGPASSLRFSASVRQPARACCRSNSLTSTISAVGWSGHGPTSKGSAAVSASSAAPVKARSKATAG
jgi:hypothetical protein